MTTFFADRLMERVRLYGPLCVGIDPHPKLFSELFGQPSAGMIAVWAEAVVEAAADKVAAIKPQSAFFEIWGSVGIAALERVCKTARQAGLLVILDAKRGDIGSTAQGYADAYLGETAAIASDALTVNPFMGLETIDPFLTTARDNGRGIAVLTRTSNPGAADIEEQIVNNEPIYMHLAKALSERGKSLTGKTGWSGLMMVAGATAPDEARAIRAAAPNNLLLVPGYGAQGAGAAHAVSGFVRGADGTLEGGVVNASRSITFGPNVQKAGTMDAWMAAVSEAIDLAQDDLVSATRQTRAV